MRISDWSSDVCSSDLMLLRYQHAVLQRAGAVMACADRSISLADDRFRGGHQFAVGEGRFELRLDVVFAALDLFDNCLVLVAGKGLLKEIGRSSCRERVGSVRVDPGGRRSVKKK